MCKHCANLVEDKEVVHRFFEVGARRLNALVPKRTGRPLHRQITADDVQAPELTVTAIFWQENSWPTLDGYRTSEIIEHLVDEVSIEEAVRSGLTLDGPPYFEDNEPCGYCNRPIGGKHEAWCRQ